MYFVIFLFLSVCWVIIGIEIHSCSLSFFTYFLVGYLCRSWREVVITSIGIYTLYDTSIYLIDKVLWGTMVPINMGL